ncbi:hypothetical protein HPB48_000302 [Haemaphysalis longicornis]|uniref:Uncharacterized protein n=1 Tax=Haemaphysalis longicornis TaxID=44386 RepID=A0A9J6G7N3_HAELO|nr:hypothetical protein HPB48_000302 [Haemaphysalis longicornis]
MELYIWKGDWGLPSIDTACLEVMVIQSRIPPDVVFFCVCKWHISIVFLHSGSFYASFPQAYAKFSGAPLKTREVRRPWSGTGTQKSNLLRFVVLNKRTS